MKPYTPILNYTLFRRQWSPTKTTQKSITSVASKTRTTLYKIDSIKNEKLMIKYDKVQHMTRKDYKQPHIK